MVYFELSTRETSGHGCQFHHPTLIIANRCQRLIVQI